jgi:hypothetical protein
VGWERRRGRRRRNRGRECRQMGYVYNGFNRWNHWRKVPVGDSASESATSLYGYLGLNPSIIPSVKSSENTPRHHTVASFKTNYRPSAIRSVYTDEDISSVYSDRSPTELCRRYIPTELETELFLLVRITDENISSIIPLVFAGFLVVYNLFDYMIKK